MADLAARVERKADHERSDVLLAHDVAQHVEVGGDTAAAQRAKGPREAERILTHREADRAIADVEGKIPHEIRVTKRRALRSG